jgi:hypothetical protein
MKSSKSMKRFHPHRMGEKTQAKRMGGRMRGKRGMRH